MSRKKSHPNLGLYFYKKRIKCFIFSCFPVYNIAHITDNLYFSASKICYENAQYTVALNFSFAMFRKLLQIMPKDISKQLVYLPENEFKHINSVVKWSSPISVGIKGRINKRTLREDKYFLTFKVTDVFEPEKDYYILSCTNGVREN